MTGETLWLLWTSKGWDVPLAVAEMLVVWMRNKAAGGSPVMKINSKGEVSGTLGAWVTVYDMRHKYINDYAPLLLALWVLNAAPRAVHGWYNRYPHVKAVLTDPECIEWARRIKP